MASATVRVRTLLLAAVATMAGGVAQAADYLAGPAVVRPREAARIVVDTSRVPACQDPFVTGRVVDRFRDRESEYWNSGLFINAIANPREIAYRPWGSAYVVRRFCSADVYVTDGRRPEGTRHAVYYSVAEDAGFAGIGWAVEYCVTGLDRSLAYAPNCKMARP